MGNVINLIGQRFGRLIVVDRAENDRHNKAMWLCRCDCGKDAVILGSSLNRGKTRSCGCLQKESASIQAKRNETHGMTGTRLYNIWLNMNARCFNKNHISYAYYGGRGIEVCDTWKDDAVAFRDWAIANGYRDDLTIDRIDANGPYSPENCRWISQKEQANNRRNNRIVSYGGESHTISEWSSITGIRKDTLRHRIDAGWSPDLLFTSPRR